MQTIVNMRRTCILVLLTALILPVASPAASTGSDDASLTAYSGGWTNNSNGGTGFGAWTLVEDNPGGGNAGFYRATNSAGLNGIGSGTTPTNAWGSLANGPDLEVATAFRAFSGGGLTTGQQVTVSFEHGSVIGSGRSGVTLRNGNSTGTAFDYSVGRRFEFLIVGNSNVYNIIDGTSGGLLADTGIPISDGGLRLTFTLRTADTYDLTVLRITNSQTFNFTGRSLTGTGGSTIDSIALFDRNAEGADVYFNSLSVSNLPVQLSLPQFISYQGRLLTGTSLVNGSVSLLLKLYTNAVGGTPVCVDSNTVTVVDGLYSTFIGDNVTTGSLSSAFSNGVAYLEVTVNGTTLSPREQVGSVAYSLLSDGVKSGGVTAGMLAAGAVQSTHIADGAITSADIATGTVQGFNIAVGAIGSVQIANGSIASADIASGAIQSSNIATGSISGAQIADGSLSGADLAQSTVTTTNLADLSVGSADIQSTVGTVSLTLTITNPIPLFPTDYPIFGGTIAPLASNRLVIGAPYADQGTITNAGRAYIYDFYGARLVTITNPSPFKDMNFGRTAVAVGGDRLVIGAPGYPFCGCSIDPGTVYLYNSNGTYITDLGYVGGGAGDQFGSALSALGTSRILVAATYSDFETNDSGRVIMYDIDGNFLWAVTNPVPSEESYFGQDMADLGGGRFAISATGYDGPVTDSGRIYIFELNPTTIVQLVGMVTNPAPEAFDQFGWDFAPVGDDRIVVGTPYRDVGATPDAGMFQVFNRSGTLLNTVTNPTPAAFDYFGSVIRAVGDSKFLVWAKDEDPSTDDSAILYLYGLNGDLLGVVTNPTPEVNDGFGASPRVLGENRLAVGAYYDDASGTDQGSVHLFNLNAYTPGLVAESVADGAITVNKLTSDLRRMAPLAHIAATGTTTLVTFNAVNCTATRLGTGSYRLTFTVPPTNVYYNAAITPFANAARMATVTNRTTALVEFNIYDAAGTVQDGGFSVTVFGGL